MLFKQVSETKEVERPWQEDVDRLQQTLQEVLQAVSRLSGVDLTGTASESQGNGDAHPQLDCKTLKDRIRNDLEAFAATTASEMARQAERQTRLALAAVHNEATGQVDQVVRELREKLHGQLEPGHLDLGLTQQTQERISELVQRRTDEFARWVWLMCKGTGTPIPVQIENLLEPYVEEAQGKLTESFRNRFETQLADYERLAHNRLQGTLNVIEGQMTSLEEALNKVGEQNSDSVTTLAAEKLRSVADEAAKHFEDRIRVQVESDLDVFQTKLEQAAESMKERLRHEEDEKAGIFKSRMSELETGIEQKRMTEISESMEHVALNVVASTIENLHQQSDSTLQHSKEELHAFLELQMEEVRLKIKEMGQSVQESLSQSAEGKSASLRALEQEVAVIREKSITDSRNLISAMTQETLESMKNQIRETAGAQLEEVNKIAQRSREKESAEFERRLHEITDHWYNSLVDRMQADAKDAGTRIVAEVKANSDSVMQELSDKVDASALVLRNETAQATSSIQGTLQSALDNYQKQLAEVAESRLEEHRQAIRKSLSELQVRLERSAQVLNQEINGRFEAGA
jgi:hypothetical protein